jgi:chemotaxis signal transduction protein
MAAAVEAAEEAAVRAAVEFAVEAAVEEFVAATVDDGNAVLPAPALAGSAGYVMVDIGAVLVAVPVQDVVQGVAWPERLDLLPRRSGAACGVFDYLGQPVAMLDLALWVQLGGVPRPQGYPRALIVRGGGHLVAIAVDAVRGLQKIGADAVTRISHDDDADEIFHSVARSPAFTGVANVLDVQRLMALARTWSGNAADVLIDNDPAPTRAPLQRYAVVAGNDCQIGFEVADMVEVLPAPALAAFQSAQTEGLCIWRGRHVPVTTIARCFPELAAPASSAAPLLAVFERDGLALGVLLHQVPVIRQFALHDGEALCAVADTDGMLVQLIGMAALYSRFPERLLSREASPAAERTAGRTAPRAAGYSGLSTAASVSSAASAATNQSSHILFDADGVATTPIDGIEAVLELPPLAPGASHISWRGIALPLRDLRAPANQSGSAGTVIVVKGETAPLGFIVDGVQALVQARAGRVSRLSMPGRGMVDLLTTDVGGGQATYSTRDLAQLARAAA